MAKIETVKTIAKPTVKSTGTVQSDSSATVASNPTSITVVVVDAKGQPTAGANVSIKPSNSSAVTNSAGEVQFQLGSAMKYDITATYGSNTVTVPYYVTKSGATRIVVNPIYVKSIEQQLHRSSGISLGVITGIGGVLVLAVAVFVFWKFFSKKYKRVNDTDL